MRKIGGGALVAVLLVALAPVGRTDPVSLGLVRVAPRSASEAAYLMSSFDETHNHSDGEIELLLWPGDRARLDALGLEYEVVTEDVVARDRAAATEASSITSRLPGPDRSDYRRLVDYENEMKALAAKHKSFIKLITMPFESLEGRTVYGLEIAANVKKLDGRPVFYMDALHHAREWPAAEFAMIYAHYLAESFGTKKAVTRLLKRVRIIVVPIVNVDGFDYSREAPDSQNRTVSNNTSLLGAQNGFEGYWRKNRRSLTGVTVPVAQKNPDAYGVDPNRNYPYLWGDTNGGSSSSQISATYRGAAPFSEPETRNVRSIILGRNVTGVITGHTYQNSVLQPGGDNAPDLKIIVAIGQRLADAMGYDNRASVGYPTTGTTDDWAYSAIGSLGYTLEHGRINFHPAYNLGVTDHDQNVIKAFDIMAGVAANPRFHSVISGSVVRDGAPVRAKLTLKKQFRTPLSPGNPIGKKHVSESLTLTSLARADGSFSWHVGPSVRPFGPKNETYKLAVSFGGRQETFEVKVTRGGRVNLGTIRL